MGAPIMSEQDDIFDIDEFLRHKKIVPPYIMKAWVRHLKFSNALEMRADRASAVTQGIANVIGVLKKEGIL
jgi:hypothetical protein